MAIVTGFIRAEDGSPASGATVRAFDKDMRSEELLGEVSSDAGRYVITYTEAQFRRAEKQWADLIVRAFDRNGTLRAESGIIFNARQEERVDLTFDPLPVHSPSELETLLELLEPVREGVEPADFTEQDIRFLVEELLRSPRSFGQLERRQWQERLEFLRLADRLAGETGIPQAAFYGWFRQGLPPELAGLLALPAGELVDALRAAIAGHIIPDVRDQVDFILARLKAIQFERGLLVSHRFVGQLLDRQAGRPLPDYVVRVLDLEAVPEPASLGRVVTDGNGLFSVKFTLPGNGTNGSQPPGRRQLQLAISSPEGVEIDPVTVVAEAGRAEVVEVRITPPAEEDTSAPAADIAPPQVVRILHDRGLRTLADIRRAGGLRHLAGLDPDDPAVRRLEEQAQLSLLSADVELTGRLIEQGFSTPQAIADAPRAAFVSALAPSIGVYRAAELKKRAEAQAKVLTNIAVGLRSGLVNGYLAPPGVGDIGLDGNVIAPTQCGCQDCEAAVSPLAYLADLLEYTVSYVKDDGDDISLAWLEDRLEQPFRAYPASCEAMDKRVRQVRLCVEILWRLHQEHQTAGLFEATASYRLKAYSTLLFRLGTSPEELELVLGLGDEAGMTGLADRLAVLPEHLPELLIDPEMMPNPLTEARLEELFGLVDTTRNPMAEGQTPLLETWRQEYLRRLWQKLDFPEDAYTDAGLPLIDPDLIGPDDFCQPRPGEAVFDLWQSRREFVDDRLTALTDMLLNEGIEAALVEVFGLPLPDLSSLARELAEDAAGETFLLELEELELTPESLTRLAEIQAKANTNAVLDGEEIGDAANILVQVEKQQQFEQWLADEQAGDVSLDPRLFWISLREPREGEWPPAPQQEPLIDPQRLELSDLAEPTAGQPAIDTWQARQVQLEEDYNAIQEARETGGFQAMLELALGHPLPGDPLQHDLDQLQADLLSGDETLAAEAEAAILNDLHLAVEDFNLLMVVRAKDADPDPETQPAAGEWEKVYTLLTGAGKQKHRYPGWLLEETEPELDRYWKILKARLPRWRAGQEARQAWQQALLARSKAPLIDPDLLGPLDIDRTSITEPPYSLWKERKQFIQQWLAALQELREAAATPLDGLDAMLAEEALPGAPTLGLSIAGLVDLAGQQDQGISIKARLDQLNLPNSAFIYLLAILEQLEAELELSAIQWRNVESILVQAGKRRLFAAWRAEEQAAGLHLGPDFFHLAAAPSLPAWRASRQDRRDWEDTLESRLKQQAALIEALQAAVSDTEEQSLPLLRSLLIAHASFLQGPGHGDRAQDFSDRFLVDANADGCQVTTRISQAIVTLQALLEGIHTGQLRESQPGLTLEDDSFDEKWQWLGSYATWRAALFVFLYPENVLLPSLRRQQTPAFRELVETLRMDQRLTREKACLAARQYTEYFTDISTLRLDASCQARTTIHSGEKCAKYPTVDQRRLFYFFARGGASQHAYWSAYDLEDKSGYAQTYWERVPGLDHAGKLLGAVPYAGFIYLFAEKEHAGSKQLLYTRFDLDKNRWDNTPQELGLPDGATSFLALVSQQSSTFRPPHLLLQVGQTFWQREVTAEDETSGSNDEETGSNNGWLAWEPPTVEHEQQRKLLASMRIKTGFYVLIHNSHDTGTFSGTNIYAHLLSRNMNSLDAGKIGQSSTIKFLGTIPWLDDEGIFRIYTFFDDNGPFFQVIRVIEEEETAIVEDEFAFDQFPEFPATLLADEGHLALHSSDDPADTHQENRLVALFHREVTQGFISERRFLELVLVQFNAAASNLGGSLTETQRRPIAPFIIFPLPVTEQVSYSELGNRKDLIRGTFLQNESHPASHLTYLEEAYYFVPVQLALQLHRTGQYPAAKDWFRTVYDTSRPPGQRKIYYGLVKEESFDFTFERAENWLLDPLDPHAIAATRRNTYTRFTLMALIRCFLDDADAEFTRDTAESVPRAAGFYRTTLKLLKEEDLHPKVNGCEALIGTIEIEVGEPFKVALAAAIAPLVTFKQPERLQAVIADINALNHSDLDDDERVFRVAGIVSSALAEQPAPPTLASVVGDKRERLAQTHLALLASPAIEQAVRRASDLASTGFAHAVALASNAAREDLEAGRVNLPWLIAPVSTPEPDGDELFPLVLHLSPFQQMKAAFKLPEPYIPAPSYEFCIPANPIPGTLRQRAELNLFKIRHCLNIAGLERELEPYAAPTDTVSGLPSALDGQISLPGIAGFKPTAYRYSVLIERARQLAELAAQTETAMLAALEKRDAELYNVLKARQEIQLARAGIRLQDLRLREAESGVVLAELQRDRSQIQVDYYQELITEGVSDLELAALILMGTSATLQLAAGAVSFAAAGFQFAAAAALYGSGFGAIEGTQATAAGLSATSSGLSSLAGAASTTASILLTVDSMERREKEWEHLKSLAQQDVAIGNQQITLAEDRVVVVEQEREIAVIQSRHAQETVDFLSNKFTNADLYDWMSGVLEGIYSYYLQLATSTAKLAENQLAFERQETPPPFIQADYWEVPDSHGLGSLSAGEGPDRRGLTGSARLRRDTEALDQYAFETDRRKLQLTSTLSLARMAPVEFQQFRESGVMTFATSMEFFDRQFPGHYLRLIKRVRVSVIALVPPVQGIHATLTAAGNSRVVINSGGIFQTIVINDGTNKSVALSSPRDASGLFELDAQSEMRLPFENMGVDAVWELRLPKAANQFDYSSLADVLLTFEYTALDSFDYRQQVIQQLDPDLTADRAFSFRYELADQWYDLHNPEQTAIPMTVQFEIRREDFPPNLDSLKIEHVVLYIAYAGGVEEKDEFVVTLQFAEQGSPGVIGGSSQTVDRISSTRKGNAGGWMAMLGKSPFGVWTLALTDTPEIRARFKGEKIEDILLVITFKGQTPGWPN